MHNINADDADNVAIRLDRSFSDELRDNVDRPTLSRQVKTGYGLKHYRFDQAAVDARPLSRWWKFTIREQTFWFINWFIKKKNRKHSTSAGPMPVL